MRDYAAKLRILKDQEPTAKLRIVRGRNPEPRRFFTRVRALLFVATLAIIGAPVAIAYIIARLLHWTR